MPTSREAGWTFCWAVLQFSPLGLRFLEKSAIQDTRSAQVRVLANLAAWCEVKGGTCHIQIQHGNSPMPGLGSPGSQKGERAASTCHGWHLNSLLPSKDQVDGDPPLTKCLSHSWSCPIPSWDWELKLEICKLSCTEEKLGPNLGQKGLWCKLHFSVNCHLLITL